MLRTIILATDGRFTLLGQDADAAQAGAALQAAGISGWVCSMTGKPYGRGKVALAPISTIGAPSDFAAAQAAFLAAR